ncbi:hypothetical protein OUHCRE20_12500 [Enterobacter hormaechei subsp. steigerwaltii]|jgi:hypothetical protein|nr:hypothetical protein AWS49_17810 [Enterobacter hormaechei subsp. steigerwaltii]GFQ14787.1 hypothetical protein NIHE141904_10970 [Enterobacter hormaechei]HCL6947652.1 hypothetical protein [Enterobacter cloacae]
MRGIFLDSKPCSEENSRSKHLVQFEDGSYSVLYSSNDIIFKKGEKFNNDGGHWKSDDFGSFQIVAAPKMSEEDANREFER